MAFYLSKERAEDVVSAYRRYQKYLFQHRENFPPNAFSLATVEWYHDPNDHRCPHDSWVESFFLSSSVAESKKRPPTLHIRLLGAYHDGHIELTYPQVYGYTLEGSSTDGQADWLYDEFRLSSQNRLIHEIEWAETGSSRVSRWIIEADDIKFRWLPISAGEPVKQ